MIIMVNAHLQNRQLPPSHLLFWQQIFLGTMAARPHYQFVFLYSGPNQPFVLQGPNVQWKAINVDLSNSFKLLGWLQFGLPKWVKKMGANLLIHLGPMACFRLKIPQAILLPDGFVEAFVIKKNGFWTKLWLPQFFKANHTLMMPGQTNWPVISKWAPNIKWVKTGLGVSANFQTLNFEEKEEVREKYSGGKEFFLINGHSLNHGTAILVLKAFSIFKKRQQAGMQIIIYGPLAHQKSLGQSLLNYKYRSDVQLIGPIKTEEAARLTAAAYVVLVFELPAGLETILGAIYTQTAVIAHENLLKSASFTGILGSNPQQTELLAEQMKLLYKDENHRRVLILSSQLVKKQYNWFETAAKFCKAVDEMVNC